jgi:hypothetical protein
MCELASEHALESLGQRPWVCGEEAAALVWLERDGWAWAGIAAELGRTVVEVVGRFGQV